MNEVFGDGIDRPAKLKIAPKRCVMCGQKFVPHSGNQKFCDDCKKKQNKGKKPVSKLQEHTEAVFGPGSYKDPDSMPGEQMAAPDPIVEEAAFVPEPDTATAPEEKAEPKEKSEPVDIQLKINGHQILRMLIDKETVVSILNIAKVIQQIRGR